MIALMMMLAAPGDFPQFRTGNSLYEICSWPDLAGCNEYIEGVADTTTTFDNMMNDKVLCLSDQVTVGQTRDVVIKFLRDNPATRETKARLD